jgi:pimeloyl-ACP methyl ester carboxylesterase
VLPRSESGGRDRDLAVSSTDGVTIVVHDLGGSGPPLLLCHATGFHGRVWQPVADRLEAHHAIAPDLRGHGDSQVPDGLAIDWHGFADDVLAVIDALELTDVIAAGHSKGGAALLLAEQARPGTFRSLYCFEPIVMPPLGMPIPPGGNPLAEGARRRRSTFPSYDAAYDNFASKPPLNALHPDALRAYVQHGFALRADGSVEIKCRPEIEAATFEMGSQHGGFERLDRVRCPVTVARGKVEMWGPASFAAAIVDALPAGTLEEHPTLGHFGPLEDPATIAACIEQTVASP